MKICVAQTRPVKGDRQCNIEQHKKVIALAVSHGADTVMFPELSITGYEPQLAAELATTEDDSRFDVFQHISNAKEVTIGIGAPVKTSAGICIGMLLFHPYKERQTYLKKYIHADEEPFFTPGQNASCLVAYKPNIALAICYELSIPGHAANAFKTGAEIYIASVAKSVTGVKKAAIRLSHIARRYAMPVLMANCVGFCDNFECGGKTAIWNSNGDRIAQLDDRAEGFLILDTDTQDVIEKTL